MSKRVETGLGHLSSPDQRFCPFYVSRGPRAVHAAGRESKGISLLVDRQFLPVDPAKTQRFLQRFTVSEVRSCRRFLVMHQPGFLDAAVVLLEPGAPL